MRQPGDRLLLASGDYPYGLPLHGLSGYAGHPIVIEAAVPSEPPHFTARPGANTVSLVDVRYLELDGRNHPVDAVKAEGHSHYADFITLDHLYIHDHAASQQNVNISRQCPSFGRVVRKLACRALARRLVHCMEIDLLRAGLSESESAWNAG